MAKYGEHSSSGAGTDGGGAALAGTGPLAAGEGEGVAARTVKERRRTPVGPSAGPRHVPVSFSRDTGAAEHQHAHR